MPVWRVPYKATFRGITLVEAATAEKAATIVSAGGFDNDPGAEMVDWEVAGTVREDQ